jgi:uncharacterized protein (DUF58 family)
MNIPSIFLSLFPAFEEYLRNKERRSLPIQLQHRRLYVLPTRYGLLFFGILLAILVGAINHNNNLAFILAFLLGGISFISIFHTFRNLSGLTLVSTRATPVFAGQTASFEISTKNSRSGRWSLSFMFSGTSPVVTDIEAGGQQAITLSYSAKKRGLLKPAKLTISTVYPLGLFRCWSSLNLDIHCLVYPSPIPGSTVTANVLTTDDHSGESGGPGVEDFAGLKNYQPGDSLQHISWKSFSRGQGLQTKVFEGQIGRSLYFDLESLPGHDLEWKLSRICHMILKAESLRLNYGLRIGSQLIEPNLGGLHKQTCLRILALAGPGER